jgi:hypothetical protein
VANLSDNRSSPSATISLAMLRSFVSLAGTLNLSQAAEQLSLTRQTLRRNIDALEVARGERLFRIIGKRYHLTDEGAFALPEAAHIVALSEGWNHNTRYRLRRVDGCECASYSGPNGQVFFARQHSPGHLLQKGVPVLRKAFAAWGTSLARLDHPEMVALRPYMVIFRRIAGSWIFADVGEKSAYANWFGLQYARSAMGTLYNTDRAGAEFNSFISRAYLEIHDTGGVRFDHLYATLPRRSITDLEPVTFQRLLLGSVLPDGQRVLAMIAVITDQVDISPYRVPSSPSTVSAHADTNM